MKNGNGVAELRRAREDLVDECLRLQRDRDSAKHRLQSIVKQLTELTGTKDEKEALEKIRAAFTKNEAPSRKKELGQGSFVDYVDKRGISFTALVKEILPQGILTLRIFRTAQPDIFLDAHPLSNVRTRDGWRAKPWR